MTSVCYWCALPRECTGSPPMCSDCRKANPEREGTRILLDGRDIGSVEYARSIPGLRLNDEMRDYWLNSEWPIARDDAAKERHEARCQPFRSEDTGPDGTCVVEGVWDGGYMLITKITSTPAVTLTVDGSADSETWAPVTSSRTCGACDVCLGHPGITLISGQQIRSDCWIGPGEFLVRR